MATEFLSDYELALNFKKIISHGDILTGTTLVHQGHVIARILDDRKVEVSSRQTLPTRVARLRDTLSHVLKQGGMILHLKEL